MRQAISDEPASKFRTRVRAWLQDALEGTGEDASHDAAFRKRWDGILYEAGFAGLSWPTEYGGQGLTVMEEYIFHEEAARVGAPEGYGKVGRVLVGPLIQKHGTVEQRDKYLEPILRGEAIWCQGFSEPDAGSDLAHVSTRAIRNGDEYVLTGQKIWTSWADEAHYCVILAKTDLDAPRHRNLGMFLMSMDQPGIEVRPIRRINGDATFSEVFLDGARVHVRDRVGGHTDGWSLAMSLLSDERGPIEAITRYMNLRGLTTLLESCCARPTWDAACDEIVARVESVRWHALRSLENTLSDHREQKVDAVMKLMWSHTWQDLARLGAALYCPEHADEWNRQYLESRAASIFSGSTQIQRNIVAERVLGLPR